MKKKESFPTNRLAESFAATTDAEPAAHTIFQSIDANGRDHISVGQFWSRLAQVGILPDDPRLRDVHRLLAVATSPSSLAADASAPLPFDTFRELLSTSELVRAALTSNVSVPNFADFMADLRAIYEEVLPNHEGAVADYIPQLAKVNPEQFAVAICTVDGQRFALGDSDVRFCLQSTCKPINYALALEELGEDKVHQHIGREPSGHSFNAITLNERGLPHNPLINAGAIMCCSLIGRGLPAADRFDYVLDAWQQLAGGARPGFNNAVYLSERETADRNSALAYFMREKGAFPDKSDNLNNILEFYFQCCSIELTTRELATVAATVANAGVCPLTGARSLQPGTVKNVLSLMYSCGMYDFSGEFAFQVGLPAKSGVSGGIWVVIPNLMGICIWSPRLDGNGNSVRGIEFCRRLVERYLFHVYDSIGGSSQSKKDPRLAKGEDHARDMLMLITAAVNGDLPSLQHLEARGVDLNGGDYDRRTALHLAASEGQLEVVRYLLAREVDVNPLDRWGGTPLDDAHRENRQTVAELLASHGAQPGTTLVAASVELAPTLA